MTDRSMLLLEALTDPSHATVQQMLHHMQLALVNASQSLLRPVIVTKKGPSELQTIKNMICSDR